MTTWFVRPGLTLIELLLGMAILALIVGMLLPAVSKVRQSASRANCANNLKQIGLSTQTFHDQTGRLPATAAWIRLAKDNLELGHANGKKTVSVLACPADPRGMAEHTLGSGTNGLTWYVALGSTTFKANDGAIATTALTAVRMTDITDGTSNTLLASERPPSPNLQYGWWRGVTLRDTFAGVREPTLLYTLSGPSGACVAPASFRPGSEADPCAFNSIWSPHTDGGNFAFADGAVRFLRHAISHPGSGESTILQSLTTRSGGEVVSEDAVP